MSRKARTCRQDKMPIFPCALTQTAIRSATNGGRQRVEPGNGSGFWDRSARARVVVLSEPVLGDGDARQVLYLAGPWRRLRREVAAHGKPRPRSRTPSAGGPWQVNCPRRGVAWRARYAAKAGRARGHRRLTTSLLLSTLLRVPFWRQQYPVPRRAA